MKPYGDRHPEQPIDKELDALIREALQDAVGTAEPSPLVWARIRAEVEADRVPSWMTWWRRLQIAFTDTLPRVIPNTIIVALFLLLGGLSVQGYGWLDNMMITSGSGVPTSDQRQIVMAERRFHDHYHVVYYLVPVDAPPKGVRRAPRISAPSTGPKHLAVGAMDPS
jgi:hypothetical protein